MPLALLFICELCMFCKFKSTLVETGALINSTNSNNTDTLRIDLAVSIPLNIEITLFISMNKDGRKRYSLKNISERTCTFWSFLLRRRVFDEYVFLYWNV